MSSFDRSGFASLTDFETKRFKEIFAQLEEEQKLFISAADNFRSSAYVWPWDALHNWSRVWEYPYVYYHLKDLVDNKSWSKNKKPTVLDLGSGVTFFPFTIEKLGYNVICVDNDPICVNELTKAIHHFKKENNIASKLSDGKSIPIQDDSVDVLYCISVLEHIENVIPIIDEAERVLKSNGIFILTIDIDTRGDSEIGPYKYEILQKKLFEKFCYFLPNISTHPKNILSTVNSTYPYPGKKTKVAGLLFSLKQIIKTFLGLKKNFPPPVRLNVEAFILKKFIS